MPNPSSGPSSEPTSERGQAGKPPPPSARDLARHPHARPGYPVDGERSEPSPPEPEPQPNPHRASVERWPGSFGAGSSAYAFGYTTSLRPLEPVRRGHTGKGAKGYLRTDERIREDVCERLSDDDEVDASDIAVRVTDGDVLLQGTVSDRHDKRRAELIAFSVRGAIDVHNRLRVEKGLLREIRDRLSGDDASHRGHHGSGTR